MQQGGADTRHGFYYTRPKQQRLKKFLIVTQKSPAFKPQDECGEDYPA